MKQALRNGVGLIAGLFAGCLWPSGDRPAQDRDVGRAAGHGAEIRVDDGLASVREVTDGALRFWAAAPTLTIRASFAAGAADAWTVTIANCLPDAALTATTPNGRAVPVTLLPGDIPTERRFRIEREREPELDLALRSPDANDTGTFRFALLSDIQEALDQVQDIYARMNQDPSIRFVLSAGDLTEQGTPEEFERFQRELRSLQVPYYATLGNHDIVAGDGIYQRYFGRGSARFVYRGVQFTLLDSASASIDPAVHDELSGWLAEGRDRVHVVAMHIPPLDPVGERNAAFGSRNEAEALIGRFVEGKVDLTLYGHIHAFYAFANGGIQAFVSGGGGAHPELLTGIGRHYLTVDIGEGGVGVTGVVRVDEPE
jgi:3',5'-cyclic-AMP phosphodiesterase